MTGIYVHFPFCIKKCGYCDFVSYENRLEEGAYYVNALLREMEEYRGEPADTVYFGGGTPTALPAGLLARVLEGIKSCFSLRPDCEITVEANPGTCDREAFRVLAEAGVNRISLGVQSFVDRELALLGRIHTANDAIRAAADARAAGISNLSLDLMFSIPAQTAESLRFSLREAVALAPSHLSCYSLSLSEETPLYEAVSRGEILLPRDEADRALYNLLVKTLKEQGYDRYEISNFARGECFSRHNIKYWKRAPYIGLGAAAHSFFKGRRYENPADLPSYYETAAGKRARIGAAVPFNDAMAEHMFLGLRMTREGVDRREFFRAFGVELDKIYGAAIKKLCSLGLLEDMGPSICLTDRGVDVSNTVFCEFLL